MFLYLQARHVIYTADNGINYLSTGKQDLFHQQYPSLKLTWAMNITMFPGKCHQNGGFSSQLC